MSTDDNEAPFVLSLPRRTLKIAGIAFGAGFLLFLLVWFGGRGHDFYRPDAAAADDDKAAASLPLPEPAAKDGASDMPAPAPVAVADNTPDQATPAAPPVAAGTPADAGSASAAPSAAPAAPAQTGAVQPSPASASATTRELPVPIPEQSPQPEYPASALRSGQTGTVRVRVEVDAQGVPGAVVVVDRSGSRDLDRAAVDAVKSWRFQPALRNGQAVPGVIEIPFDFRTGP